MHDFEPEDLISFVVDAGSEDTFYEEINHTKPTEVKGTFFVEGGVKEHKIDVIVEDQQGNVVYKRTGQSEGIILFTVSKPGVYKFVFSNMGDSHYDKTLNFALHTFEDKKDPVAYDFDKNGDYIVVYDPKTDTEAEEGAASSDDVGEVLASLR